MTARRIYRNDFVIALAGGAAIAGFVFIAMSASLTMAGLAVVGLIIALPTWLVRPPRVYGIGLYLILLMTEGRGKRIDTYFYDVSNLIDSYGAPPSAETAILLWPSDLVLLLLVGSWLLRALLRHEPIRFPNLGYLYLAFIGWAAFASVFKADIFYLSVGEIVRQLKVVLVLVYFANAIDSTKLLKTLMGLLLGCLVVQAIITLPAFFLQVPGNPLTILFEPFATSTLDGEQRQLISDESEIEQRAMGTLGGPVRLAIYLETLLPLAFTMLLLARGTAKKLGYGAIFVLGTAAFIVSFSRMGLISLVTGFGVIVLLLYYRRIIGSRGIFAAVYVGIMVMMLSAPLIYEFMTTRPENILLRIPLMEKAIVMMAENPVFGVGLNNHTAAKMRMFVAEADEEETNPTHNHYLVVGSEVGVVGLAIELSFFALILVAAMRHWNAAELEVRIFAVAAAGVFIVTYIHMMGDTFYSHVPRSMFFLYAGLVLGLHRLRESSREPERASARVSHRRPPAAVGGSLAHPRARIPGEIR